MRASTITSPAEIDWRAKEFNEATKGLQYGVLMRAMNRLTPGVNWARCTKAMMRDGYATGEHRLDEKESEDLRNAIAEEQKKNG